METSHHPSDPAMWEMIATVLPSAARALLIAASGALTGALAESPDWRVPLPLRRRGPIAEPPPPGAEDPSGDVDAVDVGDGVLDWLAPDREGDGEEAAVEGGRGGEGT